MAEPVSQAAEPKARDDRLLRVRKLAAKHSLTAILLLAVMARVLYFLIFVAGSDGPLMVGGGDGTEYWRLGMHLSKELVR